MAIIMSVLALALLLWNMAGPIPVVAPLDLLVFLVAALALETSSPKTPGFGFFSVGAAPVLACGLHQGPALASAVLLTALGARAVVRGGPARLREALADLLPGLATLALIGLLAPRNAVGAALVAALAWPMLEWLLPGVLASELEEQESRTWGASRGELIMAYFTVGFLGAALGSLPPVGIGVLLLPIMAGVQLLAARALTSPSQLEQREARRTMERMKRTEEETRFALETTRLKALRQAEQLQALEDMTRSMLRCSTLQEALDQLVDQVSRSVPSDSVVVFMPEDGQLLPVAYRSEFSEQLSSAALIGLREPSVEECWEHGTSVHHSTGEGLQKRLFESEQSCLAALLREVGVLYVGRRAVGGFEEDERYMVGILASQASVALQAAERRQREKEALAMHRQAHELLDEWVDRLTIIIEGTRALVSTVAPMLLGERLEVLLRKLVPHDFGGLVIAGELTRTWGATLDSDAVLALDATVCSNQVPLLLDDVGRSRFSPPAPGCQSLLAMPMVQDDQALGSVVLASRQPGAFDRDHMDLLSLTAVLAAVCYQAAARHQQLVQAHQMVRRSQVQLVQASKMAAMGQFAAGIAHELNTPLASVQLMIEGAELMMGKRPDRAQEKLETARAAVQQAASIVSKLMVYSRSEGARPQKVDLNSVVADTLYLVQGQLERDGVVVIMELSKAPPIHGVPTELQQVLTNLVMNARDAGAKKIEIRTRKLEGGPVLEVDDDGSGVPQDVADRIFEPFFTTKPVGRGTGLGLSVSHEIVVRCGGRLELVPSQLGGACFRLSWAGEDAATSAAR